MTVVLPGSARSVAVVGASERNFFTRCVVDNLRAFAYDGDVIAVNPAVHPAGGEVLGLPAVPSVADLPEAPDVAVLGVRADRCPAVARELVDRGTRTLLVVSDGFAEAGTDEGRALEQELAGICHRAGATLVGPNGVGAADFHSSLVCIGAVVSDRVRPGPVSVVSQSGGLLLAMLDSLVADGVGADLAVSVGNGASTDVVDAVVAAARRPTTEVVCAFVEGFPADPQRLEAAMEALAAEGVQLVVLKSGRSEVARELALSHTATITGSRELATAFFARHGVVEVDGIEAMARAAHLALVLRPRRRGGDPGARRPRWRGLAVITSSGGGAALLGELAEQHGVELARFDDGTLAELRRIIATSGHVANPVDLSGRTGSDPELTRQAFRAILRDPEVAVALFPFSVAFPDTEPHRERHREHLETLAGGAADEAVPFVVASIAPQPLTPWVRDLAARHPGTIVVSGLAATMQALGQLVPRGPRSRPRPSPAAGGAAVDGAVLSEADGRDLLVALDVPLAPGERVATLADLPRAWGKSARSGPHVLKAILPGVGHKAAVGGVALGLVDLDGALAAAASISAAASASGHRLDGFLLQPQVGGTELLLGFGHDPTYGPNVTLGLGGVLAETTGLHAAALLPLGGTADVTALVHRAGLTALLQRLGDGVTESIGNLVGHIGAAFAGGSLDHLLSIEINPLFVTAGGDLVAADVLAIRR